jgi:hypothetical protein
MHLYGKLSFEMVNGIAYALMSMCVVYAYALQWEFLIDFAALAMSELQLRQELKQEHLSYITATAHNLKTPMACFDLCLGIIRDAAAAMPEPPMVATGVRWNIATA